MSTSTAPNTLPMLAPKDKATLFTEMVDYLNESLDATVPRDAEEIELAATYQNTSDTLLQLHNQPDNPIAKWASSNTGCSPVLKIRWEGAARTTLAAQMVIQVTAVMLGETAHLHNSRIGRAEAVKRIVCLNEKAIKLNIYWSDYLLWERWKR